MLAAAVGYDANRVADSRYQELDRICQTNPARCLPRLPGGEYTDAELESRYQDVKRMDRRATFGLVGAELGVGAALALFLLDLRHAGREPPDIPYKPPALEVGPSRSGGMELRLQLRR